LFFLSFSFLPSVGTRHLYSISVFHSSLHNGPRRVICVGGGARCSVSRNNAGEYYGRSSYGFFL
jgi:hypothetical protein